MEFRAVIDVSAIIWDHIAFEERKHDYHALNLSLIKFIDKFQEEKPYIILRTEMLNEMIVGFPFSEMPKSFWAFGYLVYNFLGGIAANRRIIFNPTQNVAVSIPNLVKDYLNANTKTEVRYLVGYIHSETVVPSIYFTFSCLWDHDNKLRTEYENEHIDHETIISDNDDELNKYFLQYKRIFEPSPKHHGGREAGDDASPLSCYNGHNSQIVQGYLDNGFQEGERFFNFDLEHDVYVVFAPTGGNPKATGKLYHAYDEADRNRIPPEIRKKFNK